MGCDIHPSVEVRTPSGTWEIRPTPKELTERNYDAFAILADVRNGYGFAGADTGEGFDPIAQPRGLPEDSPAAQAHYHAEDTPVSDDDDGEAWQAWLGDHSHSWVTLAELEAVPWDRTSTRRGIVSLEEFDALTPGERPTSYCSACWGPNRATINAEHLTDHIRELAATNGVKLDVRTSWPETYAESADNLYSDVLPALRALARAEGVSADDVRIVFGFDS